LQKRRRLPSSNRVPRHFATASEKTETTDIDRSSSAPDDLHQGCVTQAWLATSEDELARSTGGYFYHQRPRAPNPIAADLSIQ
jgi:hypothetical protein